MKEKFKEWAAALKEICDPDWISSRVNASISDLTDFLQRMADIPDDEPDDREHTHWIAEVGGSTKPVQTVTKANRDWWKSQCMWARECAQNLEDQNGSLVQQLAAANARIKQLEDSLCDKMTADNQAMGLYDPTRPVLTPEQFDAVIDFIDKATYISNMKHRIFDHGDEREKIARRQSEYVESKDKLRKLLVGG